MYKKEWKNVPKSPILRWWKAKLALFCISYRKANMTWCKNKCWGNEQKVATQKSTEKENYWWNYRKWDCSKKTVFSKTDYPN